MPFTEKQFFKLRELSLVNYEAVLFSDKINVMNLYFLTPAY